MTTPEVDLLAPLKKQSGQVEYKTWGLDGSMTTTVYKTFALLDSVDTTYDWDMVKHKSITLEKSGERWKKGGFVHLHKEYNKLNQCTYWSVHDAATGDVIVSFGRDAAIVQKYLYVSKKWV